jgi:hypothetical protein
MNFLPPVQHPLMSILLRCTCGRAFQVKEEFAGRRARCSCGNSMIVPQPATSGDAENDVLRVLLADELSRRGETDIREEEAVRQPPRRPQIPPSLTALTAGAEPAGRSRSPRPAPPRRPRPPVVVSPGIVTGLLMMVGAAVWFFVGLEAGIIFFYPPILFVLGLGTMIQGFGGGD